MQVGECKKQQQMTQNQDQQFGQFFSEATSSVFLDLLISWNRRGLDNPVQFML